MVASLPLIKKETVSNSSVGGCYWHPNTIQILSKYFLTINGVHVQYSPEQIKRKSDLVLQHLPL